MLRGLILSQKEVHRDMGVTTVQHIREDGTVQDLQRGDQIVMLVRKDDNEKEVVIRFARLERNQRSETGAHIFRHCLQNGKLFLLRRSFRR